MAEQVNHPKHYNQHPAGIECISIIRNYTCDIANALKYLWRADQNIKDICQIMSGQRVEGIHFAKPGCERDTEPEQYDPLNIIVREGEAYCLSNETRKKANGGMYSPCELCALHGECEDPDGYTPCDALYADNRQYLQHVGRAEYNKHFGTIEVIDELKESLKDDDEEE